MNSKPDLNLFKSRADVRLRAALQRSKLEVLPPCTDEQEWKQLERMVKESKDPKDVEYWTNRLEHELFYRGQWRAIHLEDRRRERFRKLVDKTGGDCFEAYKAELVRGRDLREWLETRVAELDRGGTSAGKRIAMLNRLERVISWMKELKEMMQ